MKKEHWKTARTAASCLMLLLLFGCAHQSESPGEFITISEKTEAPETVEDSVDEETEELVTVFICGAVNSPGVYELSAGSRLYELIDCAEGLREDAALTALNQAMLLEDAQMIVVPTEEEMTQNAIAEASDGLVNINTAGLEELMTLPGIGKAKAQSIIDYRTEHGAFSKIEDLKKIEGIKDGVFSKLEDLIKVN
ncbi:MAG: ComEA family DNA-binding protein [bacterium]|nr:ComEA family DNA-binding protein [bacterium]